MSLLEIGPAALLSFFSLSSPLFRDWLGECIAGWVLSQFARSGNSSMIAKIGAV